MKFLLPIINIIFLFSCSITKETEKKLYGKWVVTSVSNESMDKTSEPFRNLVNDMLSSSILEMNKDYSYTFKIIDKNDTGSWKLSDDAQLITFIDKPYRFEIIEITEGELIINQINDNDKMTIRFKKVIE